MSHKSRHVLIMTPNDTFKTFKTN